MKNFALVFSIALLFWQVESHGADHTLHADIKATIAGKCDKITYCEQYVEVSCHPEVDGPLNYYDNKTGKLIMKCGGICDSPSRNSTDPIACKACPPLQWSSCQKK